jgi:hypothetical protein
MAGASMVPVVGEVMDGEVLFGKGYNCNERIMAAASLFVNFATVGLSPNYGAVMARRLKDCPQIKPGVSGGETAGKVFPQSVRRQAFAENSTQTCVYCRREGVATQVDHSIPRARS